MSDLLHRIRLLFSRRRKRQRLIKRLKQELRQHEALFDSRWAADMRGIKKWQETTGRTRTWPDHADLVVYLVNRLEAADAVIDVARELGKVLIVSRDMDEDQTRGLDITLHIAAYDAVFGQPDTEADADASVGALLERLDRRDRRHSSEER